MKILNSAQQLHHEGSPEGFFAGSIAGGTGNPLWLNKQNSEEQMQKGVKSCNRAQKMRHEGSPEGFLRVVLRARPATKTRLRRHK